MNIRSDSYVGTLLGRTSVHSTVREVILAAYDELGRSMPDVT